MYLVMRNSNSESVFLEPFESKPITVSGLMAMLIELRYALTLDCTPKKLSTPISIFRTILKRRNGYSISSHSNLLAIQEVCRMHNRIKSLPYCLGEDQEGLSLSRCNADESYILQASNSSRRSQHVSNLRFTPSAFDSFTKNTEVQYTLKNPVAVNISIIKKEFIRSGISCQKHSQKISTKPKERIGTLGLVIQRKVYSLRSVHT